jgi:hypothetical protein
MSACFAIENTNVGRPVLSGFCSESLTDNAAYFLFFAWPESAIVRANPRQVMAGVMDRKISQTSSCFRWPICNHIRYSGHRDIYHAGRGTFAHFGRAGL